MPVDSQEAFVTGISMGDLETCDDSAYGRIGFKSYLLLEDLDVPCDEEEMNDLTLQELGKLCINDSVCSQVSNMKDKQFSNPSDSMPQGPCKDVKVRVGKSCLSELLEDEHPSTSDQGCESSSFADNPIETKSMPPLVSSQVVSAVKGSRAALGKTLDPKLRVSWAPDVYDPPVSSSSHTTKAYVNRRPKAHKHRPKHAKGKPSKSGGGEKKPHPRRSSAMIPAVPRLPRWQAHVNGSALAGLRLSRASSLGIAEGRGKEPTCGGSFHMESPWPPPVPLGEAS